MNFESIRHSYTVLNLINESSDFDVYICSLGSEKYLLVRLKSDSLKMSVCQLFTEMCDNADYDDLKEVFTYKNDLIAVFEYSGAVCGFDSAGEDAEYTCEKKLKLLYDVISGLCIHDIPVCLAEDMLHNNNIGYRSDGNVGFCYNLKNPENYAGRTMKTFTKEFSGAVKKLFREEIENNTADDILAFCNGLQENVPESYLGLFERYREFYKIYSEKLKNGLVTPETRAIKLWKAIKKLIPAVKMLFTLLLIIAAVVFLLKSLGSKKSDETGSFKNIGTVIIEEYSESE